MITLTAPLPPPSGDFQSQEDRVSVVLVNGDQCSELWGTAAGLVEGVELDYGCSSASEPQGFYAGGLETSNPLWTIKIAPRCVALPYSCTGSLITVDVSRAWH
jgi:hypothetical protein